jgi:hypothetical protein
MNLSTILLVLIIGLVGWITYTATSAIIASAPTDQEKVAKITALAKLACGDSYTIKYQSGYTAFSCNVGEAE